MVSGGLPFVTVAIPCLDEAEHIAACVADVLAQDYPADRREVMVADGGSRDGTRAILDRLCRQHPSLRVVDNPDRLQAAGLNRVLAEARGEVIVRMDVHARYAPDFLRQCVLVLAETGAANAGGAARPRAITPFQRAVCAAFRSPLAYGGARFRNPEAEGWVDTVFPGAFPRRTFEVVGGFDPGAETNEDAELNQRIAAAGGGIYLSRRIVVHYLPRGSFAGLARQYFRYGRGRARTALKHRGLPTIRPAVPFLGLVGGLLLLLLAKAHPGLLALPALYLAATAIEAVRVGAAEGARQALRVGAIFPLLHLCHGAGFAAGLWRYGRRPDWLAPLPRPIAASARGGARAAVANGRSDRGEGRGGRPPEAPRGLGAGRLEWLAG